LLVAQLTQVDSGSLLLFFAGDYQLGRIGEYRFFILLFQDKSYTLSLDFIYLDFNASFFDTLATLCTYQNKT